MNHRTARSSRRTFRFETLESRALLAGGVASSPALAAVAAPASELGAVSSRVFVKFNATASLAQENAVIHSTGGSLSLVYPDGLTLIQLGNEAEVASAIKQLEANSLVVYAQADQEIHDAAAVYPNDPGFPYEWGLNNANNIDIDAPEAWGITTGSPSTIVAVLDSGLDLSNPDFANRIWTNPTNDAAAGYPNDTHGWNFVSNTNNVNDDNGHGTFVTSEIAAAGNNLTGVAGVAWNVQIMPVKFLDANGDGTTDTAVSAIDFAVDHGAKVINASWGGIDYTQPLYDAIAYANAHNVVFVTAAGNDGTDNDVVPSYPASLHLPNELSVAAVDSNGQLPSFSNYGPNTVDLAAPGVNILGDYPTALAASGLQVLSGTSMSTAYVTGVIALLEGLHPNYTATQIVQRIDSTTKALPSLAGKTITGGMVDAYQALATTDTDVRSTILAADEYYNAHGATPQGFVTGLYLDVLDRGTDPGGLAYWSGLLQAGTSTRQQVVTAIIDSTEAKATEVAEWYQADLGRTASIDVLKTDAGVGFWTRLLTEGYSDETVESYILASPEYLLGHGASPPTVAAAWYENLTGRAADSSGLTTWSNFLWAGETPLSVVRAFQATPEAKATKVARWYSRYLARTSDLATLKTDPGVLAFASTLVNP